MKTLKDLIIDEMLTELNRGVPAAIKYTYKGGVSRYGELKLFILVDIQGRMEKEVRKNLWQYVFIAEDFLGLTDTLLHRVYQDFSRKKNMQM